jgi:hypothetical protein
MPSPEVAACRGGAGTRAGRRSRSTYAAASARCRLTRGSLSRVGMAFLREASAIESECGRDERETGGVRSTSGDDGCTNPRRYSQEAVIHAAGDACGSIGSACGRAASTCGDWRPQSGSRGRRERLTLNRASFPRETVMADVGDGHGSCRMQGRFTWETVPNDAEPLADAMASVVGSWWMDRRTPWRLWSVHRGWIGGYRGVRGRFIVDG